MRSSSNAQQLAECSVNAQALAQAPYAKCDFINGTTYASCVTTVPALVNAISTVHGDSYVLVNWDKTGTCTQVIVQQSSAQAPKTP